MIYVVLLILAKPVRPAQDVDFGAELVAETEETVGRVAEQWNEMAGPEELAPPEVALGGGYLTALDDASLIRKDFVVNAATSMAVVLRAHWDSRISH